MSFLKIIRRETFFGVNSERKNEFSIFVGVKTQVINLSRPLVRQRPSLPITRPDTTRHFDLRDDIDNQIKAKTNENNHFPL